MKRLYYIVACLLSWMMVLPAQAQEENTTTQTTQQQRKGPRASRGERAKEKEDNGLPELTIRAQELNERMTQQIGNARWMRVIYRQVDLMKEQNAPLYYPVRPMNNQMNLFTLIFQLLSEGKLKVYEYLDGYEVFDDEHLVNFKELLDRFHVYYEEVPGKRGEEPALVINESDVPSEQVRSYYVKEAWYFDQNNSLFDVKLLAICPLLTIDSDFGLTTSPMFWLPYENIRPYVTNSYIMTSNLNNAALFTIDDYFRQRMFDGEIIKTQNLMNQPLQAYCPTPDSLKAEQARIEKQLVSFEDSLWMKPDTAALANTKEAKEARKKAEKEAKKAAKAQAKANKDSGEVKAAKAPKAQKSTPVRSVRRRR